ncbi:MAG: hypothetical protein HZB35_09425 [Nitrospirae bacterium]|nr:hypothetical protein [Nitrospirota bacterium]
MMDKLLHQDCRELMALCQGVRRAVQRQDVYAINRLNVESGRLMADFQAHWDAFQTTAARSTSDGDLTLLHTMIHDTLTQVETHHRALGRALAEAGPGIHSSVTGTVALLGLLRPATVPVLRATGTGPRRKGASPQSPLGYNRH